MSPENKRERSDDKTPDSKTGLTKIFQRGNSSASSDKNAKNSDGSFSEYSKQKTPMIIKNLEAIDEHEVEHSSSDSNDLSIESAKKHEN